MSKPFTVIQNVIDKICVSTLNSSLPILWVKHTNGLCCSMFLFEWGCLVLLTHVLQRTPVHLPHISLSVQITLQGSASSAPPECLLRHLCAMCWGAVWFGSVKFGNFVVCGNRWHQIQQNHPQRFIFRWNWALQTSIKTPGISFQPRSSKPDCKRTSGGENIEKSKIGICHFGQAEPLWPSPATGVFGAKLLWWFRWIEGPWGSSQAQSWGAPTPLRGYTSVFAEKGEFSRNGLFCALWRLARKHEKMAPNRFAHKKRGNRKYPQPTR
jgi:hypothetical protein